MTNSVAQLYRVTRAESPILSQYYDNLLCPTTGMVEPLRLELFAEQVNYYALLLSVKKKPVGRFYRAEDNKEIEPRYWTADMQKVYDIAIKGNPVKSSSRLSLWGKIVFSLVLLLALVFAYNVLQWTGTIPASDVRDSLSTLDSLEQPIDSLASVGAIL